jgi:hypothetical protein
MPETKPRSRSDFATVVVLGVLAFTMAAVVHETVGHGTGCAIEGGRITLLTSTWFRCAGAGSITDMGGTIASLLFGAMSIAILSFTRPPPAAGFLLLMFGALSLFWGAGQLIIQPLVNRDDLFFVTRRMGWDWTWRPVVAVIGIAVYSAAVRWMIVVARRCPGVTRGAILVAYGTAIVTAAISGLMWSTEPIPGAIDGFETLTILPAGLLVAAGAVARGPREQTVIARSWTWIVFGAAVFAVFLLTQARGLGTRANVPLHAATAIDHRTAFETSDRLTPPSSHHRSPGSARS